MKIILIVPKLLWITVLAFFYSATFAQTESKPKNLDFSPHYFFSIGHAIIQPSVWHIELSKTLMLDSLDRENDAVFGFSYDGVYSFPQGDDRENNIYVPNFFALWPAVKQYYKSDIGTIILRSISVGGSAGFLISQKTLGDFPFGISVFANFSYVFPASPSIAVRPYIKPGFMHMGSAAPQRGVAWSGDGFAKNFWYAYFGIVANPW